jgi:hypothetical protein
VTVRVRFSGLRELARDFGLLERKIGGELTDELAAQAEPVAEGVRRRAQRFGSATVAGVAVGSHPGGAVVEQRQPKTTGLRPDFGEIQMQEAFIPALVEREDEVIQGADERISHVLDEHGF